MTGNRSHEKKIQRIVKDLKEHNSSEYLSIRKRAVSHEVPKVNDKRYYDKKIDVSDLNNILYIDPDKKICIAEPGITFHELVQETMKYGLVPIIVPELKTITIGGAVAGCSIESMSYKYGGFHDTCIEYDVITGEGEVLTAAPNNENSLIFQMMHGTFGTLGIISKITLKLTEAKPFVKVMYDSFTDIIEYQEAIDEHYKNRDVDFMDGIIHSPGEYVLSKANFVDEAPYTNVYDWTKVYYASTKKRNEDYLRTSDYFFRYNRGITNVYPKSFLGRFFFGKFIQSTSTLEFVKAFHRFIPQKKIPITIDTFIPFSKFKDFMDWYRDEIGHFPLWCVPYKMGRRYEWISSDFLSKTNDDLYIDLAVYGMKDDGEKNYYKLLEDKLMEIGGQKTLISNNFYSEEDFWKIWNRENYWEVKSKTDPNNVFRDLYTKTCKTMQGIE